MQTMATTRGEGHQLAELLGFGQGRKRQAWQRRAAGLSWRCRSKAACCWKRDYRPPPPKKRLASRRICERMNGSGSAPITIDPGWPHPFQHTTLPGGVF